MRPWLKRFFASQSRWLSSLGAQWLEEVPQPLADHGQPILLVLCLFSIVVLYVQLIFGAMFRHHGMAPVATRSECILGRSDGHFDSYPRPGSIRQGRSDPPASCLNALSFGDSGVSRVRSVF
jgi:hypothetical protein